MVVELNESEVLSALRSQYGFPTHATMAVTVGRKSSSKFTIDIPTLSEVVEVVAEEPHLFSGHDEFE